MRRLITRLGEQLGFNSATEQYTKAIQSGKAATQVPFSWLDKSGAARFEFYILASAVLGEAILQSSWEQAPETTRLIVLPGSRANLAAYKLQNNPLLKQEVESGWHIVKYRHLRRLAESPFLTAEIFKDQLNQDLITFSPQQIPPSGG